MSLRAAVVGCGSRGARRVHALRALGIDQIALTDRNADRARDLAATVGGEIADSVEAATARADAVLVCTPPASRAMLGLSAVRQGAHVFIEAPLSVSLEDIDPLLAEAATGRRVVMVGSRSRFHPGLERIRVLLEARTLGRVYAVSMCLGAAVTVGTCAPDRDGRPGNHGHHGVAMDAVQWFDALRWLFGKPAEVTALRTSVHPMATDGEEVNAALVRVESGAVIQVYMDAFRGPEATRIDVVGTDGTLNWSAADNCVVVCRQGGREWREERVAADEDDLDRAELRHFFACVLTGRTPVVDALEGRASLAFALAVQRASRLRRALALANEMRRCGRRRGLRTVLHVVHAS